MKVVFNEQQLAWIRDCLGRLFVAVHKDNASRDLLRQLGNLRYKFTPNASYVNLSVKERDFINSVMSYRASKLVGLDGVGDEAKLLGEMKVKLCPDEARV